MVSVENTKECDDINLSCKRTWTHGEANSQGDDDGDKDNVVLLTLAV